MLRIRPQTPLANGLPLRVLGATVAVAGLLLGTSLTAGSAGDLSSQIAAGRAAAASLRSQVAADTAQLARTSGSLRAAENELAALQSQLESRQEQLRQIQDALLAARNHLVDLENRLHVATTALAANLVATYENQQPDLVTVILDANGFNDLLERLNFMHRIGRQDAEVVTATREARAAVRTQVRSLGTLEQRDLVLTRQVLAERNQVAALQIALLHRQIAQMHARAGAASRLSALNSTLTRLEAEAAAQEARAAAAAARAQATGTANVGGIAVQTGGMVHAPPGRRPRSRR